MQSKDELALPTTAIGLNVKRRPRSGQTQGRRPGRRARHLDCRRRLAKALYGGRPDYVKRQHVEDLPASAHNLDARLARVYRLVLVGSSLRGPRAMRLKENSCAIYGCSKQLAAISEGFQSMSAI